METSDTGTTNTNIMLQCRILQCYTLTDVLKISFVVKKRFCKFENELTTPAYSDTLDKATDSHRHYHPCDGHLTSKLCMEHPYTMKVHINFAIVRNKCNSGRCALSQLLSCITVAPRSLVPLSTHTKRLEEDWALCIIWLTSRVIVPYISSEFDRVQRKFSPIIMASSRTTVIKYQHFDNSHCGLAVFWLLDHMVSKDEHSLILL